LCTNAVPFAIDLNTRFRDTTTRHGVLIHGPSGWGEFAPFPDYTDAAASRWLDAALEAAYGTWPDPMRTEIPVNAIIPEIPADHAAAMARSAVIDHGCTTIKVKVGGTLLEDEARVAAVRDVLQHTTPQGRLRIDVNGAWTLDEAITALQRLQAYDLEYVEQPLRSVDDLRELRRRVTVPIAIDESIRSDPEHAGAHLREIADIAVIKVAPIGGVHTALQLAERIGLPVVVSGSLDSSVGLAPGLAFAGALSELGGACGLGTGLLLATDVVDEPVTPKNGIIPVRRIAPNLDALAQATAAATGDVLERMTTAWWLGPHERWAEIVAAT
jgi:O-succinylbenzoate synthase